MIKKYYSMLLAGTVSIAVESVMLMSDTLICGIFLGADAVSGITIVSPLYSAAAFFSLIFSLGVPILYSSEIGSFRKKEADRVFGNGLLLAIITGLGLFIFVLVFGKAFIQLNRPSAAISASAADYLFFIKYTILLFPVSALLSECIFADGGEALSSIAGLLQAIGNVAGSIILCQVMGVKGIALSSFLFNCISLLILASYFFKKSCSLRICFYFSFDIIKKIVRYSIIDAESYLFIGMMIAVLNTFISIRFGSASLILVSVISLSRELQFVFDGIGEAISPILTIYYSENCSSGMGKIYHIAQKTAIAEGIICMVLTWIIAPFVPDILHISDPAMASTATVVLRIISISSVFVSFLYFLTSYDLLIDRITLGSLTSALRDILLPAPLAVLLGYFFGIYGVSVGIAISPALTVLLVQLYLRKKNPADVPLLLGDMRKIPSFLYDFSLEENNIINVRDRIWDTLKEHDYDKRTINNVCLLFEDTCMLILEENKGSHVDAECSLLLLNDRVRIILRDTGKQFDVTSSDMKVSSLRSYVVSNIATHISPKKKHLSTINFNRNAFEIELRH